MSSETLEESLPNRDTKSIMRLTLVLRQLETATCLVFQNPTTQAHGYT